MCKNEYFLVEAGPVKSIRNPENDELPFDYEPKWVTPDEVIANYEKIIEENRIGRCLWIKRERKVLDFLRGKWLRLNCSGRDGVCAQNTRRNSVSPSFY